MSTDAQHAATTVSTVAALAGTAVGSVLAMAARATAVADKLAASVDRATAVADKAAASVDRAMAVADEAAAVVETSTAVADTTGVSASAIARAHVVVGVAQGIASGVIESVSAATSAVSRHAGRAVSALGAAVGRIVLESPQGLAALVRSALATARDALADGLAQLRGHARDDLQPPAPRSTPSLTLLASRDEREGPRAVSSGYGTVAQGNGPPQALVRAA